MRVTLACIMGVAVAALLAPSANAQRFPPGDWQSRCRDISMNGQFLTATCGGVRGGGQSSINVSSCPGRTITVDSRGALACANVSGGRPPSGGPGFPGGPNRPGVGRNSIRVFDGVNFTGRSRTFSGTVSNLSSTGFNDRIRSVQVDRWSSPWLLCRDRNFRGSCRQIDRSASDLRRIGLDRSISSLRPIH